MSGFVPMDASWWPLVRDGLPKPWPREAAMMDLRWHADAAERREGKPMSQVVPFPGRPALMARWGWTDWAVKQLMKGEEWADRWKAAEPPPADRQRAASAPPAEERTNADTSEETASAPPADRQSTATRDPYSQDTRHKTPETPCSPPPATAGSDAAPSHDEETPPPATPPPPQKQADAADRLYAVYQRLQPNRSPTPTPDARKAMRRILAEAGGQERAERYLVWVHQSEDQWARRLRGREPWPDGSTKRRMSPEELARSLGGRLDEADAWHERGRTTADARAAPGPANVHPLELLRQRLSQATP